MSGGRFEVSVSDGPRKHVPAVQREKALRIEAEADAVRVSIEEDTGCETHDAPPDPSLLMLGIDVKLRAGDGDHGHEPAPFVFDYVNMHVEQFDALVDTLVAVRDRARAEGILPARTAQESPMPAGPRATPAEIRRDKRIETATYWINEAQLLLSRLIDATAMPDVREVRDGLRAAHDPLYAVEEELRAAHQDTVHVHDHGPEEGPGLACRESLIDGRLVGACMAAPVERAGTTAGYVESRPLTDAELDEAAAQLVDILHAEHLAHGAGLVAEIRKRLASLRDERAGAAEERNDAARWRWIRDRLFVERDYGEAEVRAHTALSLKDEQLFVDRICQSVDGFADAAIRATLAPAGAPE